jgi:hypothetical protein
LVCNLPGFGAAPGQEDRSEWIGSTSFAGHHADYPRNLWISLLKTADTLSMSQNFWGFEQIAQKLGNFLTA